MKVKVVIFDLDDTLISELDFVESGYHKIAEDYEGELGCKANEIYEELITLSKASYQNVFDRLLENYDMSIQEKEQIIKKMINTYKYHIPILHMRNGMREIIDMLKKKNIKLGIITDGDAITQRNKLNAIDASTIFDHIIVTDELGKEYWKPNIRSFNMMKTIFEVEYPEIVYIGDNPKKDFYMKKQIPISTIRYLDDQGIYKDAIYCEEVREDFCVKNTNDLYKLLDQLTK